MDSWCHYAYANRIVLKISKYEEWHRILKHQCSVSQAREQNIQHWLLIKRPARDTMTIQTTRSQSAKQTPNQFILSDVNQVTTLTIIPSSTPTLPKKRQKETHHNKDHNRVSCSLIQLHHLSHLSCINDKGILRNIRRAYMATSSYLGAPLSRSVMWEKEYSKYRNLYMPNHKWGHSEKLYLLYHHSFYLFGKDQGILFVKCHITTAYRNIYFH